MVKVGLGTSSFTPSACRMARARVVLPAPRSPHSATASPRPRPPAMARPSRVVASRSGRGNSPRNVSEFWAISSAFSGHPSVRKGLLYPFRPHANPAPELPKRAFGGVHSGSVWTTVPNESATDMSEKLVIIGAGQAGSQAVQSLRAEGFDGPITMVGDEAYAPYQRPPLSKAYLLGSFERPRLFLKADNYYAET